MRVPLSWLREFVDVDLTPEQLAERLTLLGMEVSAIERIGADWQRVVVGELLEVNPHPNSQKLSLTRVRVGDGKPELSIVCGATNIRPSPDGSSARRTRAHRDRQGPSASEAPARRARVSTTRSICASVRPNGTGRARPRARASAAPGRPVEGRAASV